MLRKAHRPIFAATHLLARLVGHDNNFFTIPKDHDPEDIIEVTMEDLNDEQKKLIGANVDAYTKLCLQFFNKIRGKVIQKSQLLNPSVTMIPVDDRLKLLTCKAFKIWSMRPSIMRWSINLAFWTTH